MSKYRVTVSATITITYREVEIEADSEAAAQDAAIERHFRGELSICEQGCTDVAATSEAVCSP